MDKWDSLYLDIAGRVGQMSHAQRSKVGAVLVKDRNILAFGYNGTPSGMDNTCEHKHVIVPSDYDNIQVYIDQGYTFQDGLGFTKLTTKPEVLHAESNAIAKIARSTQSSCGATLYVTLSPCMECAKMIVQSGIKRVVFRQKYRNEDPITFLIENEIEVEEEK